MVEIELIDGSRNAKLCRFVRLTVYSYLNLETVLSKLVRLSIHERINLENSAIARTGRKELDVLYAC